MALIFCSDMENERYSSACLPDSAIQQQPIMTSVKDEPLSPSEESDSQHLFSELFSTASQAPAPPEGAILNRLVKQEDSEFGHIQSSNNSVQQQATSVIRPTTLTPKGSRTGASILPPSSSAAAVGHFRPNYSKVSVQIEAESIRSNGFASNKPQNGNIIGDRSPAVIHRAASHNVHSTASAASKVVFGHPLTSTTRHPIHTPLISSQPVRAKYQ